MLFLSAGPDVSSFTTDPQTRTKFDNNGGELDVSRGLWGDYQVASEQLAADLVADSSRMAKLVPASLPTDPKAKARAFVTAFARRAYRRPLTAPELDAHVALFEQGAALFPAVDAFTAGVQLTVQALLQSPHFVYRVERGTADAKGTIALDQYAIASRLSFMLWDSLPDDALLAAADGGKLNDASERKAQALRMLADPKAKSKLADFHKQLLELGRYDDMHPKGVPAGIGAEMREETQRFVADVVIDHDGSLKDLLTATHSFVNGDLAALYGLTGSHDSTWKRAELDPMTRSGLLTQPGFLTYRSGDTAPILRGVFINQKILCAALPPPPAFMPPMMTGTTRRERVNSITGKGTCGESCHARLINPAGYPLEYFDDVGRYRNQDKGKAVDAAAEYTLSDGVHSYDGPVQWGQTIAHSSEAHACYVRHWLEFGYGRAYAAGDAPLIARIGEASRTQSLSVRALLVELIASPTFTTRRTESP